MKINNTIIYKNDQDKYTQTAILVDNTTEHTVSATYNFGYISLKWYEKDKYEKGAAAGYYAGYYTLNSSSTETIVYCSWTKGFEVIKDSEMKALIPGTNKPNYGEDGKTLVEVEQTLWWRDDHNVVEWNHAGTLSLSNVEYKLNESRASLKPAETNLAGLILNNYLAIDGEPVVKVEGATSPYFSATYDGEGGIKLTQLTSTNTPKSHEETIEFNVVDCFGNKILVSLPIQIVTE